MKIYIAGRITGDPHYKRKFRKAEKILARKGYSVMNPACLTDYPDFTWHDFMDVTSAMQEVCEAVYFLPDWNISRGAMVEYYKAEMLGQKKYFDIRKIPKVSK